MHNILYIYKKSKLKNLKKDTRKSGRMHICLLKKCNSFQNPKMEPGPTLANMCLLHLHPAGTSKNLI